MSQDIELEKAEGAAWITLNRPEVRNALTSELVARLVEMLRALATDPAVRVVALRGRGVDFSSGGDMQEIASVLALSHDARRAKFHQGAIEMAGPLWSAFRNLPQPVIASVRGHSVGVGLQLVLLSDLVVASDNAKFLAPQVRLGHTLDHGESILLPMKVGPARALQLALLGKAWNASEAERFGLVNWVIPDAELENKTEEIVAGLAASAPIALQATKELLKGAAPSNVEAQLKAEADLVGACAASRDFEEAIRAFQEKRAPKFIGA